MRKAYVLCIWSIFFLASTTTVTTTPTKQHPTSMHDSKPQRRTEQRRHPPPRRPALRRTKMSMTNQDGHSYTKTTTISTTTSILSRQFRPRHPPPPLLFAPTWGIYFFVTGLHSSFFFKEYCERWHIEDYLGTILQ